jgi:asparagine synthase (glutamine-hydrolysing)
MCGIAGYASPNGGTPPSYPRLLDSMTDALTHRGPDDAGRWTDDGIGLGIRRLSIIDLEGGHQPLSNEDGSVWIVMNGEIFNHLELRERLEAQGHRFKTLSDTEAVVHAYEEWGENCVDQLNGQFAFSLWDRRHRRLFIARDRVGIKPLYYLERGGEFWFASELKALLRLPFVNRTVDFEALRHYLVLEYVPSPLSIIEGIRKLSPGHSLVWEAAKGSVRLRQYWDVSLAASEAGRPPTDRSSRARELLSRLEGAVRKEMIADVPVGVFLSGGIDSSAVAAMMVRAAPGNVNSFSVGFRDQSFDESGHARSVAAHLDLTHHELILEPEMLADVLPLLGDALDEPFADPSIIPTYLLSRFAREHVKVALGGDGGDELFAGYPTLRAHRLTRAYGLLPRALRAGLRAGVGRLPVSYDNFSLDFKAKRFVQGAGHSTAERHLRWMGAFEPESLGRLLTAGEANGPSASLAIIAGHAQRHPELSPLNQVLYLDMKLYLEGDILTKLDRASMLASLEARVPLLNQDMIEYVTALPIGDKLHGMVSKYLFKQALRGVLPEAVLRRPKRGFGIPAARWLRGPLKEELLDLLTADRLERDGFFDPAFVQGLVGEHMAGRHDNRKALWTLFTFQRWQERYGSRHDAVRQAA